MTDPRIASGIHWLATTGSPSRYTLAVDAGRESRYLAGVGVAAQVALDALSPGLGDSEPLAAARNWAARTRPRESWEVADTVGPAESGAFALVGSVGAGKSVALAHHLVLRRRHYWPAEADRPIAPVDTWRAKWVDCREFVGGDFSRVNKIPDLLAIPCLVLDDVSDCLDRDAARSALANLLGARHEARRLTLMTSNLSVPAFAKALGTAACDRIRQTGEVVRCSGDSLRSAGPLDSGAAIRDAARLVELVDAIGSTWRPNPEHVAQLQRLLGVSDVDAIAVADEVATHEVRQREETAAMRDRLTVACKPPPPEVVDLDAHNARMRKAERMLGEDAEALAVHRGKVAQLQAREAVE